MEESPQGKITIQKGLKSGSEITFSEIIAGKDFNYLGEARERLEAITWKEAEEIANQEIDSSFVIRVKSWKKARNDWEEDNERLILYFYDEERRPENANQGI